MKYLKLVGWLALYFVMYLLSTFVGGTVLAVAYVVSLILAGKSMPLDSFIASNLFVLLLVSGVVTLVFGFVILLIRGYKPFSYLKFRIMPVKHTALMILMGASFAIFVNCLLTLVEVDRFLPDYVSDPLVDMMTSNLLLTFLTIGIIVPIYEEFLVRGLMYRELEGTLRQWPALLLQGLIFGAMHGNVLQFSYAFPMGIFLGYVYTKFGSIWAPILIHLVWNSTSLLMGAIMPESSSFEAFLLLMTVSGILFAGGVIYSILSPSSCAEAPPEQLA